MVSCVVSSARLRPLGGPDDLLRAMYSSFGAAAGETLSLPFLTRLRVYCSQDPRSILVDGHSMFEVRSERTVRGGCGPAVVKDLHPGAVDRHHGLDRQREAGAWTGPGACASIVEQLGWDLEL